MKNKKGIMIIVAVIIAIGLGTVTYNVIETNKQNEIDSTIEALHDKEYVIEYGDEFDFNQIEQLYIDTLYEEQTIEFVEVDTSVIEENEDKSEVENTDEEIEDTTENEEIEVDKTIVDTKSFEFIVRKTKMTFDVITKDTQMPIMTGETSFKIEEGKELDYKKIVAEDKVDGKLEVTYEGDVDFSKPNEYKVIAKAKDNNDNEITETITITVTKKVVEAPKPKPPVNNNNANKKPNGGTANNNKPSGGGNANNSKPNPPANNNSGGGGSIFDVPYTETLTFDELKKEGSENKYFWLYKGRTLFVAMNRGTCDNVRYYGESSWTPLAQEMVAKSEAMCFAGK